MSAHDGHAPAPSEFPPPVDSADEFLGAPTDPEDERIEVGVAIVGGGQAGLACASRLLQLLEDDPELTEKLGEVPVAVIEKGKVAGAHQLSGAVMNPVSITQLFPDDDSWPHYGPVEGESVYFMLNRRMALPLRPVPPPFRNHGNYVIALAELNRWLAEKAEEAGAYILTETSATKLLVDDGVVRGVRSGDKGRGRDGEELSNFEPGSDVVVHTLGWPLRTGARYREFGGSFIYPMGEDKVSIGFVVGLNYADLELSVHDVLQQFKLHPRIRAILEGGRRLTWGAKAIPEGGYW